MTQNEMKLTTKDIGSSLKSILDSASMVWDENSNEVMIEAVDDHDPNNLILRLENDQTFIIRIIAS